MKRFRQVQCSDRLPDVKGDYDTDCGRLTYRVRINKWGHGVYSQPVKYWMEEIKLPTEEEIQRVIISTLYKYSNSPRCFTLPSLSESSFIPFSKELTLKIMK